MIEVATKDLLAALRFAGGAVEKHSTVPVLEQIHMHANGSLQLRGTDLDTMCEASVDYVGDPASPFLSGDWRRLSSAIGYAGGTTVQLLNHDDDLSVIVGGAKLRVSDRNSAEDFPQFREIAETQWQGEIGQREIALLARVALAVSTEETRYYLNGIYLHAVDEWTVRAVATDGHRMNVADLKMPGNALTLGDGTDRGGVIIPRKVVNLLLKKWRKIPSIQVSVGTGLAPNADADLTPQKSGKPIVEFKGAFGEMQTRMLTTVIDGTYPDYTRVVPTEAGHSMTMDVGALRRAVQMLSVLSDVRRTPAVKLEMRDGSVLVSGAFIGLSGSVDVPCVGNVPPGFTIGFNGRYLLDVLAGMPGEMVAVRVFDQNAPSVWRDPTESDFFSVLMPMRVGW